MLSWFLPFHLAFLWKHFSCATKGIDDIQRMSKKKWKEIGFQQSFEQTWSLAPIKTDDEMKCPYLFLAVSIPFWVSRRFHFLCVWTISTTTVAIDDASKCCPEHQTNDDEMSSFKTIFQSVDLKPRTEMSCLSEEEFFTEKDSSISIRDLNPQTEIELNCVMEWLRMEKGTAKSVKTPLKMMCKSIALQSWDLNPRTAMQCLGDDERLEWSFWCFYSIHQRGFVHFDFKIEIVEHLKFEKLNWQPESSIWLERHVEIWSSIEQWEMDVVSKNFHLEIQWSFFNFHWSFSHWRMSGGIPPSNFRCDDWSLLPRLHSDLCHGFFHKQSFLVLSVHNSWVVFYCVPHLWNGLDIWNFHTRIQQRTRPQLLQLDNVFFDVLVFRSPNFTLLLQNSWFMYDVCWCIGHNCQWELLMIFFQNSCFEICVEFENFHFF